MAQKTSYFATLDYSEQCQAVEALLFSSDDPLSAKDLFRFLIAEDFSSDQNESKDSDIEATSNSEVENANYSLKNLSGEYSPDFFENIISAINDDLEKTGRPFRIVHIAGGFQYATTSKSGEYVQRLLKSKSRRRLSQAALETLAIIAYKQPIAKAEIESIRGVNSNEVVNSLLEKDLVAIAGRAETIGKPLLYGVTDEFLRIFGLKSIGDLPKLREIDELMERSPQGVLGEVDHETASETSVLPDELTAGGFPKNIAEIFSKN